MSTERNKLVVQRLVEQAYNRGRVEVADEVLTPRYKGHGPTGETYGRKEWKQAITTMRQTFPDYRLEIEDLVAEGDRVVWRWTMHGTDLGGLGDRPPTGRRATMQGINIERLENGKIAETWSSSDHTPMLQALGLIPDA